MSILEYSERFARMGFFANKVHNCKICPFFSTLVFRMVNHVRTHRSPLTPFNCGKGYVEIYFCKDCNFQTDMTILMKKHIENRHSSQSQNEENTSQGYICKKCGFETYFLLKWLQHTKACVRRKQHSKLKSIKVRKIHAATKAKYICGQCHYKFIKRESLNIHKITKHPKREEIRWYQCEKCPYKSPHEAYLRSHLYQRVNHKQLKMNWHECDKCLYKTSLRYLPKKHRSQKHASENLSIDNSAWVCKLCPFKTDRKCNLKRHISKHLSGNGIKRHQCDRCSFLAKLGETMKKKYNYQCDKCSYRYAKNEDLQKHVLRAHQSSNSEKPDTAWYHCQICKFTTKSIEILNEHTRKHQEKEEHTISEHQTNKGELFKCDQCPFTSKNRKYLQQHVRFKHLGEREKWFQCRHCSYRVKHEFKLNQHILRFHSDDELSINLEETVTVNEEASINPEETVVAYNEASFSSEKGTVWYHCRVCKFITKSIEMLNKHTASGEHLAIKEGLHKCVECAYKAKTNNELKQHTLEYHSIKTTVRSGKNDAVWYKCRFCEFKANSIEILNGHISTHQIVYKCAQCQYLFTSKEYLQQHVCSMHLSTKETERFKCRKCSYNTKTNSELNQHVLEYHWDNLNSEKRDTGWHKCDLCEFNTVSSETLTRHIVNKHQTKKTQLYNGGQGSSKTSNINKNNLQRHILPKPSGEKGGWFECHHCSFRSKSDSELKQHLRMHSSDDETVYINTGNLPLPPLILLKPPSENKTEWFQCNHCSFRSKTNSQLNEHMRTHLSEAQTKWYKCGVCEFKTNVVGAISTHIISKHAN